jgi:hypothetical protein
MNNAPEQTINPKTGLYSRNPTRLEITASAENQQEIVDAVVGIKSRVGRFAYQYGDIDKTDPPPLSGVLKIKEMTEDQLKGFFKSLMRFKPNIIKMHINLGNFANKKRVNNTKTNLLSSNKPRFHTEVAEKLADVFSDTHNVVEVLYTVALTPNSLVASAEVYSVSDEDYNNAELFSPAIGIEHLITNI